MENNIFYGKDESEIISHKKTDYYSLCSLLRKQKLFEVMMVDFEKPDLPPDEIRKLYYRYIEEYMYTALGTSALKKDKVDLFYFSALTVVYLCYNVYPGWGNNDLDDGHYIEIDDLVEYLYHFTENSEKDIRVSMNTLKPLSYLMYSVTQHNYSCELSEEFHILERCEETWVKDLIKLICFNESLHDGQSMDVFEEDEGHHNYDGEIFWEYINRIPDSLASYLWQFSDKLAEKQLQSGFRQTCNGTIEAVENIHIIPMLLPYTDLPEICDYEKYTALKSCSSKIFNNIVE